MNSDFTMITVEDGQGATELHNQAQCAAAVAAGSVGPDTQVVVYAGGKTRAMRAGEVPVFAALFAPPPTEPVRRIDGTLSARVGTADKPVGPWTTAEAHRDASPPAVHAEPEAKAAPATPEAPKISTASPPSPTTPPTIQKPDHSARNAIIAIVVVLLLGFCASVVNRTPKASTNAADTAEAATETAAEAVDPEAGLPVVSYYVRRPTNIQLQAGPGKGLVKLDRGTFVSGVVVPNRPEWLHLRSGDYTGRYLWLVNLATDAPPQLDRSMTGERTAWSTESIRIAPRTDAPLVAGNSDVVSGKKLSVAGLVESSWAEILLEKGGVGYVPASVFDVPDTATQEDTTTTAVDTPSTPNLHQIFVYNSCNTSITVAIMYRNADGWQVNDGATWTMDAGQSYYPHHRNRYLFTDNRDIYYSIVAENGRPFTQGSIKDYYNYGSRRLGMRVAKLTPTTNNDYRIDFNC